MDTGTFTRAVKAFWVDSKNRLAFLGPAAVIVLLVLIAVLPPSVTAGVLLLFVAVVVLAFFWFLTRLFLEL